MSIIVLTFPGNNLRPSNQRHNGKTSLRYGGIENQIRRISISKTKDTRKHRNCSTLKRSTIP